MSISIHHTRDSVASSVITKTVEVKKNHLENTKKNIFGVELKKNTENKFLKEARDENKRTQILGESVMKDKIDELRALRKNIDQLTPKTVSSHTSDLAEMEEFDYNDPDACKRAQKLLEEKQKVRDENKRKKTMADEEMKRKQRESENN